MYNTFFGFREKPFKLVPNPDFLYLSRSHQIALAHLTYAVEQGDGFVVITGEVGTGKTTLCRIFLERLDETTDSAYIFNPKLDSVQLLNAICNEFGIRTNHNSLKQLLDVINGYLIMKNQAGRKVVLLIDEAQNLSVENLEMVRMLSNLETTRSKLLQIILVGQPELGDKLDAYEMRQLAQRISLSTHLSPLSLPETIGYIQHRVNIAAQRQLPIFSRAACHVIHQYANGIPRMINIACDRALLTAYSLERSKIGAAIAKMAIREITSRGRPEPVSIISWVPSAYRPWVFVLLGILALMGIYFLGTERFGVNARSDRVSEHRQAATFPIPPADTRIERTGPPPETVPDTPTARQSMATRHSDAGMAPSARPGLSTSTEIVATLDRMGHQQSRLEAVSHILSRWQQPPPHPAQLPTRVDDREYFDIAAHQYGLRVHTVHADWSLVEQLRLPAIIALRPSPGRQTVYIALVGWDNGVMQLAGGDNDSVLYTDLHTLMPYLSGTVHIFWKNIVGFDGVVTDTAPPRAIAAIKTMLHRVGYDHLDPAPVFDDETRRSVMDFQMRHRLVPDGLVGPLTKMVLIRESNASDMPQLSGVALQSGA